jgi:hypothetical protein
MDSKEFSRLEALYRLAMNNPDQNEIRNASVLLVKMLAKHNLISTIRDSISGSSSSNWTPPPYSPPQNSSTSSARQAKYKASQAPSSDPKYKYLSFEHLAIKCKNSTTSSKASFTIDYIADFLDERFVLNGHKDLIIGVPTIIDLALRDNLITPGEIILYTKNIRFFLQREVSLGLLIGVRGRSGGYKLK